jgi:hypothetical protein
MWGIKLQGDSAKSVFSFLWWYQPFSGLKWPGREADHSPPASAVVKKIWIYTSTPPYAFMVWCLIS